jgi:hypothetical protein
MLKKDSKEIYTPKTILGKAVLALIIVSFIFTLSIIALISLPITIPLSRMFPNYVEASLRHGVVIKNGEHKFFSMIW